MDNRINKESVMASFNMAKLTHKHIESFNHNPKAVKEIKEWYDIMTRFSARYDDGAEPSEEEITVHLREVEEYVREATCQR